MVSSLSQPCRVAPVFGQSPEILRGHSTPPMEIGPKTQAVVRGSLLQEFHMEFQFHSPRCRQMHHRQRVLPLRLEYLARHHPFASRQNPPPNILILTSLHRRPTGNLYCQVSHPLIRTIKRSPTQRRSISRMLVFESTQNPTLSQLLRRNTILIPTLETSVPPSRNEMFLDLSSPNVVLLRKNRWQYHYVSYFHLL